MTLAAVHREYPARVFHSRSAEAHTRILKDKIGVFIEKARNHTLVFLARKGAGRVHQNAARSESFFGAVQNMKLAFGTAADVFNAPLCLRLAVFAEHSLAAARRIDENLVKPAGKPFAELLRMSV